MRERSFVEVRIGRYSLEIPASMVREAEEYTFTHVELEERERPADPDGITQLWAKKLEQIRSRPLPPGLPPGQTGNIIEDREAQPGLRQVIYHSSEYGPEQVKLFATFDPGAGVSPVILILELDGFSDITAEMTRMVGQTAREYRPPRGDLPPNAPPPDPPRFYLGRGALSIPYLRRERADVTFEHRGEEEEDRVTLQVITGASGETQKPGLIDSVNRFISGLRSELDLRTLGSGNRVVAGVRGEEVRTKNHTPGQPGFFFGYTHHEDKAHPELSLRLIPRGDDLEDNLAVWDHILSSVKRIG